MPCLWKSGKIARLSGFVSHLRARRRKSSLVVETGFPTSIADFVVKNRTKLRKQLLSSSSHRGWKKEKKIALSDCFSSADSANSKLSEAPSVSEIPSDFVSAIEVKEEVFQSELSCPGTEELKDATRVSGSRYFLLSSKLFFVLVLALVTKEIALKLTVSAILLLFLESVEKHLSSCRPAKGRAAGSDLNEFDSTGENESAMNFSGRKGRVTFEQAARYTTKIEKVRNRAGRRCDEIRSVEYGFEMFKDEEGFDYAVKKRKSEILSAAGGAKSPVEGKMSRNGHSRSSVFKRKFLTFMTKSFRCSKNKIISDETLCSKGEVSEIVSIVEDEKEEAKTAEEDEICSFEFAENIGSVDSGNMGFTCKNRCKKKHWKLGFFLSSVIVLVGLVGGRSMALSLSVSCFLAVRPLESVWSYFQGNERGGIRV